MHLGGQDIRRLAGGEAGYAMAVLLASLAAMSILWTVAIPVWKTQVQREKEAELIFRAGQYARAVALYQRRYANAFPPNLDVLLQQRFLRKKYKDPITGGDFRVLSPLELQGAPGMVSPQPGLPGQPTPGGPPRVGPGTQGPGQADQPRLPGQPTLPGQPSVPGSAGREVTAGVAAVVSRSSASSIRIFKGRQQYNQWIVTVEDVTPRRGLSPVQPGQPGMPGQPGLGPQPAMPGGPGAPTPFPSTRPPG